MLSFTIVVLVIFIGVYILYRTANNEVVAKNKLCVLVSQMVSIGVINKLNNNGNGYLRLLVQC